MQIEQGMAAIVTGGASGLGEATARALAAKGARVAVFDMNPDSGRKVAAEISGLFVMADVTSEESVTTGLEIARTANGQERVLVNCAGIAIGEKTASIDKKSGEARAHALDSFKRTIAVNLVGTFNMISKCAAGMIAAEPVTADGGRGVIVNTASIAGTDGQIGQVAYAASKGGVIGMTLPVARDLMRDGVRCCTIMPGLFNTPMVAGLPDEVRAALAATVPFPARLGDPVEFARLALSIVDNDMLNGECIRLDGALRMAPR